MGKKKITISMMKTLLFSALIPTTIATIVTTVLACISLANSMEKEVYKELNVIAEGLRQYYEYDILNNKNHKPEYDHDYVDSFVDEGIHLTLFIEDERFITSIKDETNPTGRNEGTKADPEIWEEVSSD